MSDMTTPTDTTAAFAKLEELAKRLLERSDELCGSKLPGTDAPTSDLIDEMRRTARGRAYHQVAVELMHILWDEPVDLEKFADE